MRRYWPISRLTKLGLRAARELHHRVEVLGTQRTPQARSPCPAGVIEAVTELGDEPRPASSVTFIGSPGWRRIRIGNYRVVYEVRDDSLVVLILRVGSRGSIHRRLSG